MKKNNYSFGEKLISDLLLLVANDKFKADMKKLSRKYKPPSPDENQYIDGKEEMEFLKSLDLIEMTREYSDVINKYNPELFDYLIKYLFEKGYMAKIIQGEKIKIDPDELTDHLSSESGIKLIDKKRKYLTLNVYADTTIKDIQKNWTEIKKVFKKENSRKKVSDNLKRDLRVLSLKNKGLKAKEITLKINTDPKFKNKKITYQEVSRIIKRLKEKAQKNMPHKDS
jgi:hypothetical protein